MINKRRTRKQEFFQTTPSENVKYVVFVFNADNQNTKNNQMNALAGIDFSSLNKQTGTNLFMYIIVMLIIAILAAALFFILRK